jgi:hypothetical protein
MGLASAESRTRRRRRHFAACGLLLALAGCVTPSSAPSADQLSQSERLQKRYPDLWTGRFAVLADFEDPAHASIFCLDPPTDDELRLDPAGGIVETGGGALRVELSGSARLVADARNGRDWTLKRDWRPYDLLLMSIFAPAPDVQLDFAVVAGRNEDEVEARSLIPLQTGWNLVRLDLSEAGDILPLDDIQQVRWSVAGRTGRTPLVFDDLILASNRRMVFGDESAGRGQLFVVQEGRRITVGSAGRFDVSFANGQIVRWHALDRDASRRNNLVGRGATLGPMPIVLPSPDPDALDEQSRPRWPLGFVELGDTIATRQRLVEANAVYAQVEGLWTFADDSGDSASAARQRWLYTIYPSGHIYVTVEATTQHGSFRADNLGLVVSRRAEAGLRAGAHEPAGLDERLELRHVSYGWIGGEDRNASLLFVPRDSRMLPQLRVFENPEAERISLIAYGGDAQFPLMRWHALVCLWPPAIAAATLQENLALAYTSPPNIEFTAGQLAGGDSAWPAVGEASTNGLGVASEAGFDPELGAFVVEPEDGVVKLRLVGPSALHNAPVFRVKNINDREAWVYVNDRLHQPVVRMPGSDLIFQVTVTNAAETRIEVYTAEKGAPAPAPGRS